MIQSRFRSDSFAYFLTYKVLKPDPCWTMPYAKFCILLNLQGSQADMNINTAKAGFAYFLTYKVLKLSVGEKMLRSGFAYFLTYKVLKLRIC